MVGFRCDHENRTSCAAKSEHQHQFRKLDRQQRWHVTAWHIDDWDQLAIEQFTPWLFEEIGKILDGAERIERRNDAPWPNQAHQEIREDCSRDEGQEKGSAFAQRDLKPSRAGPYRKNEWQRQQSVCDRKASQNARADCEPN